MQTVLCFLNRAAAGILLAAVCGAFLAVGDMLYIGIRSGQMLPLGTVGFIMGYAPILGALLGSPSAILMMCFSRAKYAPWRSVMLLFVGTELGLIAAYLLNTTRPMLMLGPFIYYATLIFGATIGGVIASFFLRGNRFAIAPQDDKVRNPSTSSG